MSGPPGIDPLVSAAHAALNGTAFPRRPAASLLPPLTEPTTRAMAPPSVLTESLVQALTRRRSGYRFGAGPVTACDLAAVLRHGVLTAPRAGGLPSVVSSLVVCADGDLPLGVHRVEPHWPLPGYVAVRDGDPRGFVAGALEQPEFAPRVSLWLAFAVDVRVGAAKYPPRHYRTLHLDAGAALQNAVLVASALGLTACPVMGYDDRAWSELLALPPELLTCGLVALGPAPPSPDRHG